MRDLIIQGDPSRKVLTILGETTRVVDGVTYPALDAIMEYFYSALDNNPTPNNKANLLTDETAKKLGIDIDAATVNLALEALAVRRGITPFQQIMTGRFF